MNDPTDLPSGFPSDMATVLPTAPAADDPFSLHGFFGGAPTLFLVVAGIIALGFLLVIGAILLRLVRYATATPMTSPALCIAKRGHRSSGDHDTMSSTSYYATFELPDGTRKELAVPSTKIGLIVEGDRGLLTWRADVMKEFVRDGAPLAR